MNTSRVIYNILSSHNGTTNLVSTRIYPIVAPQKEVFPYITFQLVSSVPLVPTCPGVDKVRYQIDIWGLTQSLVSDIKDQIREALDNAAPGTYDGVAVSSTILENYLEGEYSITDRIYNYQMEYLITLAA
jgi:hypothetical protein